MTDATTADRALHGARPPNGERRAGRRNGGSPSALVAIPLTGYVKYADATTGLLTVTHSGALTGVTSAHITI